ncbi:hypothetical protein CRI85_04845 [Leuconostoc pseudomesenteroides]|nr:hypothetical protein [Leuconostoc pseudomesenteroides]
MDFLKATTYHSNLLGNMLFNYSHQLSIFNVSNKQRKLNRIIRRLCYLSTISDIKNNSCYMCVDNGQLVGQFTLLSPKEYKRSISTTIYKCGLPIFFESIKFLFNWSFPIIGTIMKNMIESHALLERHNLENIWLLDQVSLDPKAVNSEIFQQIIEQIQKIITINGGNGVVLVTNSRHQLNQFLNNNFSIVDSSIIPNRKQSIPTWMLSWHLRKI